MVYNIPVVKSTSSVLKKCSQQIKELNAECGELRKKIEGSITQLRAANRTLSDSDTSFQAADVESTFQYITGDHKYSPEIRKLYYSLLADQVPISKFTDIIRTVLKCFNPSMNV